MKNSGRLILVVLTSALCIIAIPGMASAVDITHVSAAVTVTPADSGGYITSSPAGIDCGEGRTTCSITLPYDTYTDLPTVTFIAHPDPGRVVRWGIQFIGYCKEFAATNTDTFSYHGNTCTIDVGTDGPGGAYPLYPEWYYDTYNLTMPFEGTGSGHVAVSNGTNCSSTCTMNNVPLDSQLTLTATPDAGSTFTGWDGHSGLHWCERPSRAMLTTPTCKLMGVDAYDKSFDVPSPIFTRVSSASSGPQASTPVTSSLAPAAPSPAPSPITLAGTQKLSFWQGSNFGQKDKTLTTEDTKADTMVGIADEADTPLALVHIDLSKPQDWSKAAISYASSDTAYKSFVHGLTSAPGVKNGMFSLLVPYKAGDKYVGICSGASSLDVVNKRCPGIYYLAENQVKTHQDAAQIKSAVTAKLVTFAGKKYWQVDGLTGTGGFSSTTNPAQKSPAKLAYSARTGHTVAWAVAGTLGALTVGAFVILKFRLFRRWHRS